MDALSRPLVAVDANVLMELDGRLLLTSDEHLRGTDHRQLALVLQEFDLSAPVIATPGEVVKKFFQR